MATTAFYRSLPEPAKRTVDFFADMNPMLLLFAQLMLLSAALGLKELGKDKHG